MSDISKNCSPTNQPLKESTGSVRDHGSVQDDRFPARSLGWPEQQKQIEQVLSRDIAAAIELAYESVVSYRGSGEAHFSDLTEALIFTSQLLQRKQDISGAVLVLREALEIAAKRNLTERFFVVKSELAINLLKISSGVGPLAAESRLLMEQVEVSCKTADGEVAANLFNLFQRFSAIHKQQGHFELAIDSQKQAVAVACTKMEPACFGIIEARKILAALYDSEKNFELARSTLFESLVELEDKTKRQRSTGMPEILQHARLIADLYNKSGSENHFEDAVTIAVDTIRRFDASPVQGDSILDLAQMHRILTDRALKLRLTDRAIDSIDRMIVLVGLYRATTPERHVPENLSLAALYLRKSQIFEKRAHGFPKSKDFMSQVAERASWQKALKAAEEALKQAKRDPSTPDNRHMVYHKQVQNCLVGLNLKEEADLAAYANTDFVKGKWGESSLQYIDALCNHAELSKSFSDPKGAIVRLELAAEAAKNCLMITLEAALEIYSKLADLSLATDNNKGAIDFWEAAIEFAALKESEVSIQSALVRVTLAENLYNLIDCAENNLPMTESEIRSRIDALLIEAEPVLQRSPGTDSKRSLASSLFIQGLQISDRINSNADNIESTDEDVIELLARAKQQLVGIGYVKWFQFGDLMLEMAKVYIRMGDIWGKDEYQLKACECLKEADSVFSKLPGTRRLEVIEILENIVGLMELFELGNGEAELNEYRRRLESLRDKDGESNEE